MHTGIYIGAKKEAVAEARKAINDILKTKADQATMVAALRTLETLCSVNGTTISGCTIGDKK